MNEGQVQGSGVDQIPIAPFILEKIGVFGPAVLHLCEDIREIKDMKYCTGAPIPSLKTNDRSHIKHEPLQTSITVTIQRLNLRMILEHQPISNRLIVAGIERCYEAMASCKKCARKKLETLFAALCLAAAGTQTLKAQKTKSKKKEKLEQLWNLALDTIAQV